MVLFGDRGEKNGDGVDTGAGSIDNFGDTKVAVTGFRSVGESGLLRQRLCWLVRSEYVRKREHVSRRFYVDRIQLAERSNIREHLVEVSDETSFLRLSEPETG